jgi:hypothetical protein
MNILSTIREQFSPELLGQISQRLGESPEASKSALDQSLQALLGSAAAKASSPEGATSLFNLLKEKTPQEGWSTSLTSLLSSLTGSGGGIGSALISMLLGSKANTIRDFIASRSGIRPESASTLLGTGGSLLMGILGKQVASQGLGASSFGQLLRAQIPHLQGHLSPDLANMLGVGNLLNSAKAAPPPASYANQVSTNERIAPTVQAATASGSRILRFALIPVLLLLGLLYLANRHSRTASVGAANDETYTTRRAVTAISNGVETVRADTADLGDRLKSAISGGDNSPVDLSGVDFDSSGNVASLAKSSLTTLGNVIKDNPSLKVAITAYGKTADEAATRANSIKSALVKMGILGDRVAVKSDIGDSLPKVSFIK